MLFQDFTHLYPLSKTVRFELKPIGKTLEHIHAKNFLSQDETMADMYQKVKAILDDYHRDFITKMMSEVTLTKLPEFYEVYLALRKNPKDDTLQKQLTEIQTALREEVVKPIDSGGKYKAGYERLFGAKLFKDGKELGDLAKFVIAQEGESSPKLPQIAHFEKFSTYFTGFHDNRKNMYSSDDKHTAIAYRLIHENLPRFIDNLQILVTIKQKHSVLYDQIVNELNANGLDVSLASHLDGYHKLLTQEGITAYNTLLGGISGEAGSRKIQGINELINIHHNQHCQKSERIAKLRPLHKQILSDGMGVSFLPSKFADDSEVCQAVNEFYRHYAHVFAKVQSLFDRFDDYRKDGIYVEHKNLNELSKQAFGDFALLGRVLDGYYVDVVNPEFNERFAKAKTDNAKEKLTKEKDKFIKGVHSLASLEQAIEHYIAGHDDESVQAGKLGQYFKHGLAGVDNPIQKIHNSHSTIKGFLERERPAGERALPKIKSDKSPEMTQLRQLKELLDNALNVVHFAKLLTTKTTLDNQDGNFYGEFGALYDELAKIATLYNKVRDYLSQKPFSTEKYKLNFGNPTLLNGWDLNKEKDNFGVILQKDGCYYLALLDKAHKKVFDNAPNAGKSVYQKMVYKLLPGPNKMLPKVFFAKSNLDYYNPSAELLDKYAQGTHKKGNNFNLKDCHALIDFFKASINKHPEWQHFGFEFSPTSSYQDLSDFYREVEPQGYQVKFVDINAEYIDELVEQGQLYLFQIYNKDFSPKAHGKPNLHTLYFKALFSENNLANPIYKLNGEAEIFYRKASLDMNETTIHRAGEVLENKNPDNPKKRQFVYDIIKDKRYTQDKFMLHVPITMNFGVQGMTIKEFNKKVNQSIQQYNDVNVIGIDRGERHLLYLTVINSKGEILEQRSLNDIITTSANGTQMTTPYHKILDKREIERLNARVGWGEIETIKELKSGYLSHVVHQISQLMLKYNAIVVLEDLNFGFKRGRFKVEKQIYQNFENALIKKLNHLALKDKADDEIGSYKNALQLTNNFTDLKSIGKQTGFLFYVPAWNTSKIDPATGFVDLLKPRYENIAQSQAFFGKFDKIFYNADKGYFEFYVDYAKFTDKAKNSRQTWVICSHGDKRYVYDKTANQNKGATIGINVNDELKSLFARYHINDKQPNLVMDICQNNDKEFHKSLMYLLKALLALRYSNASSDEDFILSPVADDKGVFFNSALADDTQPQNADANGAYHIALKGLWLLNELKNSNDLDKIKLAIDNQTWLNFAQNR
ncbi:type V CRISPR-associated protein Cas12a/Cpf1 [Moraxella sp. K1664]|uniref:type V CRISPR-associated protein Cas12a/Cpf1 n=1 Tax=Moraxella sp. K1664 TaxID=2780077 RepID=UPI00187F809A|nr:type V CRISPR-associated protein Cas12a/Cpf1 [Moraxella sp. K1664]MBE9579391.1 type V CRISPR-associated protein Cas12a/Cpf1 [Moraxella sp. K1664]